MRRSAEPAAGAAGGHGRLGRRPERGWSWHALLAAVAGALVFANSIPNQLTYDDVAIVGSNPAIRSLTNFREIWLHDWWGPAATSDEQRLDVRRDRLYRPLTLFTFALQYPLHGTEPLGYHIGNVLLHGLACALVWRFAQVLFGDRVISLVAGLLFAVHPLHCEAVANVVGRAEVLATTFLLLGLLVLLREASPRLPRVLGATGLFFLALLAKETAICYGPVALIALHARRTRQPLQRPAAERLAAVEISRNTATWWLWRVLLLLSVCAVYLPLRYFALGNQLVRDGMPSYVMNPVIITEGLQRGALALVVLGHYVRLLLLPVRMSMDYGLRIIDPDRWDPMMLLGAVGVIALAIFLAGYRRRAGAWRQLAVCAALFLASYALISNLLLPIGVAVAERLMYWPSVPLVLMLAIGAVAFWRGQCRPGQPLANIAAFLQVAGVGFLLALGARTIVRNQDWYSNATLLTEDSRNWPQAALPARGLGLTLYRAAMVAEGSERAELLEQALQSALRAWEIARRDSDALLLLACIYTARGESERAREFVHATLTIDPANGYARRLAQALSSRDEEQAAAEMKAAVESHPEDVGARLRYGRQLQMMGRVRDAREQALEAARLAPDSLDALTLLAEIQSLAADYSAARETLLRIVALNPDDWRAHATLATLYGAGNPAEALRHAQRANELNPNEYATHVNLAEALVVNRRLEEALARYRLVMRGLQPDDVRLAQVRERISEIERLRE